ncbi:DUF5688 family protein [bacterium]|nr:DUF5688 family protein [bacterium]
MESGVRMPLRPYLSLLILIPAYDHDSYDELTSMVKEVNSTQLSKEEILSDHVYFYSRETGQISM